MQVPLPLQNAESFRLYAQYAENEKNEACLHDSFLQFLLVSAIDVNQLTVFYRAYGNVTCKK